MLQKRIHALLFFVFLTIGCGAKFTKSKANINDPVLNGTDFSTESSTYQNTSSATETSTTFSSTDSSSSSDTSVVTLSSIDSGTTSVTSTTSTSSTGTSSSTITNTNSYSENDDEGEDDDHHEYSPPQIELTDDNEISILYERYLINMNSIQFSTNNGISYIIFQNENDNIVNITTSGAGAVSVIACNLMNDCAQKSFSVKDKSQNENDHHGLSMNDDGTIEENDSTPNPFEEDEKAIQRRFKRLSRKKKSKRKHEEDVDELMA